MPGRENDCVSWKTMLAEEQMGMKWAKNKSRLETRKFPAISGMRSWNSLSGHECLTYSGILMRFDCLNIWPVTTSCPQLYECPSSLSPFLSWFCSSRFPCSHTSSGSSDIPGWMLCSIYSQFMLLYSATFKGGRDPRQLWVRLCERNVERHSTVGLVCVYVKGK